jgi:preprotein translocase subunit Sec61beta
VQGREAANGTVAAGLLIIALVLYAEIFAYK